MSVLPNTAALAQSVPWMPSQADRHAIELLVDEAHLDLLTTQWPLPRDAVSKALAALPSALPPRLAAARDRLARSLGAQDRSALSVTVRNAADALPGFGDDETPGSSVALRSSLLTGPHFALQVGGRVEANANPDSSREQFRLDDTALVTEALGVQLQAFSHRSWWSPGWQTALSLSSNSPPMTGIGFQRASASTSESRWLSWLGPWSFDFFLAQEEGVSDPANPYFLGTRITLRPLSFLEIGLTRTAQWGGRGRDNSAKSFLRLLTGSGLNADTTAAQKYDPGNEMAGFDFRARCPSGWGCAAYLQLSGEDQAGLFPSRYLGLYGLEWALPDGSGRVFAEYAETGCEAPIGQPFLKGCAYRNYAYPQGYTQAGRWIGSSFGPDSRVLTLGWLDADTESSLKLHVGNIGSRSGAFIPLADDARYAGHLTGVSAKRGFQWGPSVVTPEFDWQRISGVDGVHQMARVGVNLRLGLDDAFGSVPNRLSASLTGSGASAWTPLWVAAGLIGGSALLDHQADHYAVEHGDNPSARLLRHAGNALPIAGTGLAGLAWVLQRGSTQGDVGLAALSAGISAAAASEAIKYAVDRARPLAGEGPSHFGGGQRSESSFPSVHSSVAWAVVTPYAEHYDAPWLYGAAALTNAARVIGRDHWVSDTVAGGVLGYRLGHYFYRASDAANDRTPSRSLWLSPNGFHFSMRFD